MITSEDDLKMMKEPQHWPYWPTLPVKRYLKNYNMQCGFMYAHDKPIVYLHNIRDPEINGKKLYLNELKQEKYDTYESLLADGWVVD